MGVIDYDRIEDSNNQNRECVDYCIEFVKELPKALKEKKTPIDSRYAKYSSGPMAERTAHKPEGGGFFSRSIIEFYCIFTDSLLNWRDMFSAALYGACITTSGRYFFKFDELNASQFGSLIAEACGFNKELAETVLYDALKGDYWTLDEICEATDKNAEPDIQVNGNGNVVGGRDIYGRGEE